MNWRSAAALAAGAAALVWILHSAGVEAGGLAAVGRDVAFAGWVLPLTAIVHLGQLFLSAQAWRQALGLHAVRHWQIFRLRWIREGVNALLPVAQIGGQVVGAQSLAQAGVAPNLAAAGTILDLTIEAIAQLLFTLAGIGALLALRQDHAWLGWVVGGLAFTSAGVAAFVALQRAGALQLVERAMAGVARRFPSVANWSMEGLHRRLMARQSDWRALLKALSLHSLSWALGGAEVWIVLAALGHRVWPPDAVIIESLGMAARSAGFAVPGAVGVQEGGFVLVCGLFGVPAEAALALSVMKRLREALVGIPALAAWQQGKAWGEARSGRTRQAEPRDMPSLPPRDGAA